MNSEFWCLDFEASGLDLGLSYPIEVGITNGTIDFEALIIPHPDWFYWDPMSQDVHGIRREDLFEYGKPGPEVCNLLNAYLKGKTVYCDGGMYDIYWLDTLFAASGVELEFDLYKWPDSVPKHTVQHRALADAKQIWRHIASQIEKAQ